MTTFGMRDVNCLTLLMKKMRQSYKERKHKRVITCIYGMYETLESLPFAPEINESLYFIEEYLDTKPKCNRIAVSTMINTTLPNQIIDYISEWS